MRYTLATLYHYLFRYKTSAFIYFFMLTLSIIAANISPIFYRSIVDNAIQGQYQALLNVFYIFIAARISEIALEQFSQVARDFMDFRAGRDARIDVVKKIHDLDFAYHLSKSTGSLISVTRRGDGAFYDMSDVLNGDLLRILGSLLVGVSLLSTTRIELALIVFTGFTINIISAYFLVRYNMKARTNWNEEEDKIGGIIADNLINFDTVKLFAKETWEHQRLQNSFKIWMHKLILFAVSFRVIEIVSNTIATLTLILVLYISIQFVLSGTMSPGDLVLALSVVSAFYPTFQRVIYRFRNFAKSYTDLSKYFEILKMEVTVKDHKRPSKLGHVNGNIYFKNITFAYPETKEPVISNFELEVKSGQSVALVGRSGQGKSTLIKLLMRFYDVQTGDILIDGVSIKKVTKSDLRSHIGVVPQEPILFNNSVAYNIGYGADQYTLEQIKAAAKMAYLDEFIETLPQKYETNVGERGIKLSGGQKQRLAIARMILANPDIIVFDEATSHLDSESEKVIQDAFWNAVKGKTAIVVAHRLSTIVKADMIVVMQDGQIAERGSHRALLQKEQGIYRHFWELQTDIN